GRSFAGMVGNPSATPIRDYVVSESVLYDMQADAHGEYVSPTEWDPTTDALNLSVRTPTERYIYRSRDEDELYDHRTDPAEIDNRAGDPTYADRVASLRNLLAAEVGDVFPPDLVRA